MRISDVSFDFSTDYSCGKATFDVIGTFDEIQSIREYCIRSYSMPPRDFMPELNFSQFGYIAPSKLQIKQVIFHNPATIVYWSDKSKTVVKCKEGDIFDEETGLAMCVAKKFLGDNFHAEFKKWLPQKDSAPEKSILELLNEATDAVIKFVGGTSE